ncbi:MAG: GNAT family N-acetyltransferase [Flavobacteriaceae bacterium]
MQHAASAVAMNDTPQRAAGHSLAVEVFAGPAEAIEAWRTLFAHGHSTLYQNPAMGALYAAHIAPAEGLEAKFALLRDASGAPALLMPMELSAHTGVRIAETLGGKHCNYLMPLMAKGLARSVSGAELEEMIRRCGAAAGADIVALRNLPKEWDGAETPYARLRHQASPSFAYSTPLVADPEANLQALRSSSARRRLRRYMRRLEEMGDVVIERCREVQDAEAAMETYFAQKHERMKTLGLKNVFDLEHVRAFYMALCRAEAGDGGHLDLYRLRVGADVAAIWAGIHHGTRWSGMITSFDQEKFGTLHAAEIMIMMMLADLCRRGFTSFDLGIGEARYKNDWCSTADELIDIFVPVTAKGRIAAPLLAAAYRAKRYVKQNPRLKEMALKASAA